MRLICPNCDAQYEVPDEVVPKDGRDVQCSDCGQTWFQYHPDHMPPEPEVAEAVEDTPAPEEERAPTPEPQRRGLDPSVKDILREEAELEARARDDGGALESQPELGLDDSPADDAGRRAREARDRMARMRGEDPQADALAAAAAAGSRRDLLPDIEEINSSLRSTGDRQIAGDDPAPDAPVVKRKRRSFRRGFFTSLIVIAILVALYLAAPAISAAVPALDGAMTAYTGFIDQMRVWLDSQVTSLLTWLDTTAAASG